MKLRILDNSIRLRLNKSEVEQLDREGLVRGLTKLPAGNAFQYLIRKTTETPMNVQFTNDTLEVLCPEDSVSNWANSEQVGFRTLLSMNESEKLLILVEKDFKCLDPNREEDESDNFEHPKLESQSC